jgi:hypothetical protein
MYDQKPTTSLTEDLEVLGLLKKPSEPEKKAPLNEEEMEPDPTMAQGTGEEPVDEPPPPAPRAAEPAPKVPGVPAAPPFPSKGAEVEDEKDMGGAYDMAPEDEMAAYESAWSCVKQYYALQEGKEKLSEDDYKTVINAMSFIIETQGKFLKQEPDHDPDELPGGDRHPWAGNAENNPIEKVQGTNAMRQNKGHRYHDASPRPSEKAESLNSLVGELKQLTQQKESNDEMQELGAKIIEGFEAIRDTADEVAHSLAEELRESKESVTAEHPRVRLGKYFEGVAGDAKLLLKAISERETTDVDDAIEDLNSLSRDLKRGLAQL